MYCACLGVQYILKGNLNAYIDGENNISKPKMTFFGIPCFPILR